MFPVFRPGVSGKHGGFNVWVSRKKTKFFACLQAEGFLSSGGRIKKKQQKGFVLMDVLRQKKGRVNKFDTRELKKLDRKNAHRIVEKRCCLNFA